MSSVASTLISIDNSILLLMDAIRSLDILPYEDMVNAPPKSSLFSFAQKLAAAKMHHQRISEFISDDLTDIVINPMTVGTIKSYAFSGITSVTSVRPSYYLKNYEIENPDTLNDSSKTLKTIGGYANIIPEIEDYAFSGCSWMTGDMLKEFVYRTRRIGSRAFEGMLDKFDLDLTFGNRLIAHLTYPALDDQWGRQRPWIVGPWAEVGVDLNPADDDSEYYDYVSWHLKSYAFAGMSGLARGLTDFTKSGSTVEAMKAEHSTYVMNAGTYEYFKVGAQAIVDGSANNLSWDEKTLKWKWTRAFYNPNGSHLMPVFPDEESKYRDTVEYFMNGFLPEGTLILGDFTNGLLTGDLCYDFFSEKLFSCFELQPVYLTPYGSSIPEIVNWVYRGSPPCYRESYNEDQDEWYEFAGSSNSTEERQHMAAVLDLAKRYVGFVVGYGPLFAGEQTLTERQRLYIGYMLVRGHLAGVSRETSNAAYIAYQVSKYNPDTSAVDSSKYASPTLRPGYDIPIAVSFTFPVSIDGFYDLYYDRYFMSALSRQEDKTAAERGQSQTATTKVTDEQREQMQENAHREAAQRVKEIYNSYLNGFVSTTTYTYYDPSTGLWVKSGTNPMK